MAVRKLLDAPFCANCWIDARTLLINVNDVILSASAEDGIRDQLLKIVD